MRNWLFISIVLFQACGGNQNSYTGTKFEKPNILIIHVDDLGYNDLSVNGSEIYQTPTIDALASESVRFENAYANYPRCVPSRYAMMTASYPIQNCDVPDDGFEIGEIDDNKNYIKAIDNAGYQTAYFGKWHLGDGASGPKAFGFDTSVAAGHAGSPISFIYPFNTPKGKNQNSKKAPIKDLEEISKDVDYLTDVLTDQVISYIQKRDKNQPFMAMLAFYAVHQPLEAKEEDIQRNKLEIDAYDYGSQPEYIEEGTGRTKMRQDNEVYAAMVENMDDNVGKLLQVLKEQGITENTLIVFSSDHGGLSNDGTNKRNLATSNYPLRAGKGWLYDGGIKVPLFIHWPKKWKSRKENESIVMLMDVFPTLGDLVTGTKKDTDGKSLLPVLNKEESWAQRNVFWHSSNARPRNTGDTKSSAIRDGNYKLIHWYEDERFELYDMEKDPYEMNDISEKEPMVRDNLSKKLNHWKSTF